jgi:VWFA-related protein
VLPALLLAAVIQWPPLESALETARSQSKLVALFMASGVPESDERAKQWLADALNRDSIRESIETMSVAEVEFASPLLRKYEELRVVAKRRVPHFVIVDPEGGVVAELSAFGDSDSGTLASSLIAIQSQKSAFVQSAQARRANRLPDSYFLRGLGLSKSGLQREARTALEFAHATAAKSGNAKIEQLARVGLAALDLDGIARRQAAVATLRDIAEHPVTPEIAANAWLLLAQHYKSQHDPERAVDAYRRAYAAAPPGSGLSESARRSLEMLGAEVSAGAAASQATVHLIFSRQAVIAGNLAVAASAPSSTARVEFYVDGARVAESARPPFRATLPLGSVPRVHELKAIARGRGNEVLGEHAVTINDHPDHLSIRLVSPSGDAIESRASVEAEVRVPAGVQLDRVDVFWNETKLASLAGPPFRYELELPARGAFGYIRVVAHDNTGGSAEDARIFNGGAVDEGMRVDAVELYAIVHDRQGRIVEGLAASDFVVKEDGVPVPVTLRSAATDPITVGLALDTSGSMRPIMIDVSEYASAFLRDSLAAGDSTMLTAFDAEPHLVQPLTQNLESVTMSLTAREARGGTAIWDAVAFALPLLRSSARKRSLLLFTDGMDNGSTTTPAGALAIAREAGVAVYVVLMFPNMETERAMVRRGIGEFETLARETGGAVFRSPRKVDLPVIFGRVRDDTRGEYILTFTSKSRKPGDQLRRLSVEVTRRDLRVRAMSGYYRR